MPKPGNKRTPWGWAFRIETGDMQRDGYLGSEERRVRSPSAPGGSPASTCKGGTFLKLCDQMPSLASPDPVPSSHRHAGLSTAPSPTPLSHLLHHLLERTGPPHPELLLHQLLPVVLTPAATSPCPPPVRVPSSPLQLPFHAWAFCKGIL